MLHDAQRTSAPSATSVSISTAVWIVMCNEPVIRAPASGWRSAYSARVAISPGISCSARRISLRPNSASDRSATLKSVRVAVGGGSKVVLIVSPCSCERFRGSRRPRSDDLEQALVLTLFEAQPVGRLDPLGLARLRLKPALDGGPQVGVVVEPVGERNV